MTDAAPPEMSQAPNRELVELAVRFSRLFMRWVDRRTQVEMSYPQARLLEMLHCDGPGKMSDLAGDLGITARNLTSLADSLEADDLLRRAPHPSDRRATILELTDAGRDTLEGTLTPQFEKIGRLFDVLSPDEKTRLAESLTELMTAMSAGGDESAGRDEE